MLNLFLNIKKFKNKSFLTYRNENSDQSGLQDNTRGSRRIYHRTKRNFDHQSILLFCQICELLSFEFFLNGFHVTKSKISMVSRDIICLAIAMLLGVVLKKKFLLLVMSGNRYLPSGSSENTLSNITAGNVFVAK